MRSRFDRFELNRWQAVEESSSAAGDPRSYHEPEFVDLVGGNQRLRDRDTCVDADIAAALLLEIPNEFDQPAVEGGVGKTTTSIHLAARVGRGGERGGGRFERVSIKVWGTIPERGDD